MATGTYKNGVAIIYTYQAVGLATGKTITSTVYDEAHADSAQGGAMAEIGATGRYWKAFTPDAEGEWIVVITNTTDGGGDVVKAYAVAGHDIDSLGDAVAALENISTANVATELATYDGPTDAELDTAIALVTTKTDNLPASPAPSSEYDTEMARITADVATEAKQDVIDAFHDVPGEDSVDDVVMSDVVGKKSDTVAGTSMIALTKQLLADTGTTGSIRGADDDTLKSLSDQIDAVSAPAMVG